MTLIKKIYHILPFKKWVFYMVRVFTPPEKIYKHLYFKGIIKISIDAEHSFKMMHYGYQLENEMFWKGISKGWEKETLKLWIKACRKSKYIVDIGANTGLFALIARCVQPNAAVWAFEPVSRVYNKLLKNIRLNNYDIVAYELAISNYSGKASIFDPMTEHVYSVCVNNDVSNGKLNTQEVDIQVISLDSFITEKNITSFDLLKIDVETHEPEVLEGYTEHILKHQPVIFIEILYDEMGQRINSFIRNNGLAYKYIYIDEISGPVIVDELKARKYYNYILVPDEKEILNDLLH